MFCHQCVILAMFVNLSLFNYFVEFVIIWLCSLICHYCVISLSCLMMFITLSFYCYYIVLASLSFLWVLLSAKTDRDYYYLATFILVTLGCAIATIFFINGHLRPFQIWSHFITTLFSNRYQKSSIINSKSFLYQTIK